MVGLHHELRLPISVDGWILCGVDEGWNIRLELKNTMKPLREQGRMKNQPLIIVELSFLNTILHMYLYLHCVYIYIHCIYIYISIIFFWISPTSKKAMATFPQQLYRLELRSCTKWMPPVWWRHWQAQRWAVPFFEDSWMNHVEIWVKEYQNGKLKFSTNNFLEQKMRIDTKIYAMPLLCFRSCLILVCSKISTASTEIPTFGQEWQALKDFIGSSSTFHTRRSTNRGMPAVGSLDPVGAAENCNQSDNIHL